MRLYELAKELGVESKELIRKAHELEIPVKNHMASLDEGEAAALRGAMAPQPEPAPAPAVVPAPSAPPAPTAGAGAPASQSAQPDEDAQPRQDAQGRKDDHRHGRHGRERRPGFRGPRRDAPLSENDPFWQFGTPPETWGSSRRQPGDSGTGDPSGMAPDDPYWTFGTPPETWGSTRKKQAQQGPRPDRPRSYLECRQCGVKLEKKAAHGSGKVPCPFCNRWMNEVR